MKLIHRHIFWSVALTCLTAVGLFCRFFTRSSTTAGSASVEVSPSCSCSLAAGRARDRAVLEVLEKLGSLAGVARVAPTQRAGEILVESTADESLRPLMAKTIVESGWGLKEMRTGDLSLEDVFVQLVTDEGKD